MFDLGLLVYNTIIYTMQCHTEIGECGCMCEVAGHMGPRHLGPWTFGTKPKTSGTLAEDIWDPAGHMGPWTSGTLTKDIWDPKI